MRKNSQAKADALWMDAALDLARRGRGSTRPNPPVGAVIVQGSRIVGKGYHRRAGGPHAEIYAIRNAADKARDATMYATLEPCCTWGRTPPCVDAIVQAGIRRVVVAVLDPSERHHGKGVARLRRNGVAVTVGVRRKQGKDLIAPFTKWAQTGIPYVTLKLALSIDGRIADREMTSQWISGPKARKFVRVFRNNVDAILIGRRTAQIDNPSLLPARRTGVAPYRVVVDSKGSLPESIALLTDTHAERTIVATTKACPQRERERYTGTGASLWKCRTSSGHVSLRHLLSRLGKLGVLHLLCEGGGELAAALVDTKLVDEYIFVISPILLGGRKAVSGISGGGWLLKKAPRLRFTEVTTMGEDVLIRAFPRNAI